MVIPWVGYSLAELIKKVEPQGNAKYVEFVTLADPKTMPFVGSRVLDWPYAEGLRMDEAMHPLTLADLRHVRRGAAQPERRAGAHRGAVEVRLQDGQVDRQDPLRREGAGHGLEQGRRQRVRLLFERQSRRSTIRAGARRPSGASATAAACSPSARKTLMFNGYEAQVGQLYAGMDLKKFF